VEETLTTGSGRFTIHSEERGPHWIAWLTRDGETHPERSVVMVGETRQEAESRAKKWLEQAEAAGYL
jgi:hypothetical protein